MYMKERYYKFEELGGLIPEGIKQKGATEDIMDIKKDIEQVKTTTPEKVQAICAKLDKLKEKVEYREKELAEQTDRRKEFFKLLKTVSELGRQVEKAQGALCLCKGAEYREKWENYKKVYVVFNAARKKLADLVYEWDFD